MQIVSIHTLRQQRSAQLPPKTSRSYYPINIYTECHAHAQHTLSESQCRRVPVGSSQRRSGLRLRPRDKVLVLNCDTLCHMVHFVHADQASSKLKHVVS